MNATQWNRLQEIVDAASSLPLAERSEYLEHSCKDDETLRRQADGMLAAYSQAGVFFESAVAKAAESASYVQDLTIGEMIGPYQITCTIGHGGMGTVYRAERSDQQFRQSVAIKLVRTGPGTNQELFSRFRTERQILANINHPNIARLLDGGITDRGLPYLVMEYVEGTTLDRYIATHQMSVFGRLELFRLICGAIQHAHQNLIVHRDLKPGNIMVTTDGIPKLLDFGIAKLLTPDATLNGDFDTVIHTRLAERLMTPEYASPEQIRGEVITTATDIYGLGVLLYELLTGTRPFVIANLSPAEIERLICGTQPRPPSTLGLQAPDGSTTTRKQTDLDRIVLKALHKFPDRRYLSAAEMSADIERFLNGFPVIARPDSFRYRSRKFIGRHSLAVAAALAFVAIVVGLSANLAIQAKRARHEAQSADAVSQFLVGLFEFTKPDATQGRSVTAREILDQGTVHLNAEWKGEPTVKARLLNTLGTVYYQLGDLDRAEILLTQAETIYTSRSSTSFQDLGENANTLGMTLLDKGDYERATQKYLRALRIFENEKGRQSTEVADVLNGLSSVQWIQGNYDAAEKYQYEAVAIDSRLLGPAAPGTLTDKNNLETILADRGNYRAAEPLAREVLAERLRVLGENQPLTSTSENNLAFLLMKTGRFAEAKVAMQHTFDTRRRLYGAEHPELAVSLVMLGWWNREQGHIPEAKQLTEAALTMARKLQGSQSLDTAFDEDALGLVFLDSGDTARARPLIEDALRTRLGKHNPSQPALSQSYDHLGLIDLAEGKLPSALEQIRRALEIRHRFYQSENDWVAISLNHEGRVLMRMHNLAEALRAYESAYRIAHQNFGDAPHPITSEALYGLAEVALAQDRLAAARSALKESLRMRLALYPSGHPDLLATERLLKVPPLHTNN